MRNLKQHISAAFLALGLLGLPACTTRPLPAGPVQVGSGEAPDHLLGAGDRIRITVFGEEELSGEFLISSGGTVSLPLIGDVKATGETLEALRASIEQKLVATDMIRSPRVSADVLNYRPFYILGEVQTPGQYPYAIGMTVTKAVATAGGFTYRADSNVVFVTREGTTREQSVPVTASSWIGPGDTVRVGERTF